MKKFARKKYLICLLPFCINGVQAEEVEESSGGLSYNSSITVKTAYDDNVLGTNDPISSSVTTVSPSFALSANGAKTTFNLEYALSHSIYSEKQASSITNHSFSAGSSYQFDVRNKLSVNTSLQQSEGISRTRVVGQADEFRATDVAFNYEYGAPGAKGNIVTGVNFGSYNTINDFNFDQNRKTFGGMFEFSLRASEKSRALLGVEAIKTEYQYADSKDNVGYTAYTGMQWDATAKTTGRVTLGYQKQNYDDSALNRNQESLNWSIGATWSPKTYSQFSLVSSQAISEGFYGAASQKVRSVLLSWNHDWGGFITTGLSVENAVNKYSNGRDDDSQTYSALVSYQYLRWLNFSLGVSKSDFNSTDIKYDFDRNTYYLSATAVF